MDLEYLDLFKTLFFREASIFKKTFWEVQEEFGEPWITEFDMHLGKLFGRDEEAYIKAISGYVEFAIGSMRLQRLFNKKLKYEDTTYDEACEKFYFNKDYMMEIYLPGIFLSTFLWRHHYRQFDYYKNKFLPLLEKNEDKRFYDVGTGTGFYSTQIFRYDKNFLGYGVDISQHSREFTTKQVTAWGFGSNFTAVNANILEAELEPLPYVQSIEVLEHLTDPQPFLNNLKKLLKPGGYGFIVAAVTAPHEDHIYLYWTAEDVAKQLVEAGFKIEDQVVEAAYEPRKPGDPVPKSASFIVS